VGILAATHQVEAELDDALILGELSLDGAVRHVNGVLPLASMAVKGGYKRLFVPACDAGEAALVEDVEVYPVRTLAEMTAHLRGDKPIERYKGGIEFDDGGDALYPVDYSDIKGQERGKRALKATMLDRDDQCSG
jgi:magnesium chelatase family protein